jgi:Histidine kinase-, DNA gyrase B-, and HSP90-like ATPase
METKMAQRTEERFAYGSVLEALSRGLYPDKRHVIREFIQNAYDGLYELRKHRPKEPLGAIEVKVQLPSIFIADHGFGMSESKMQEYRYLGYSEKERTEQAGFRGIGKYSGLAIADKIIVDSTQYGVARKFRVVIHVGSMIEEVQKRRNPPLERLLSGFTEIAGAPEDKTAHYTFVELHKIRPDSVELLSQDLLIHYLSRIAPVPLNPDFEHAAEIGEKLRENIPGFFQVDLQVNDKNVFKGFVAGCKKPEFETILFEDDQPDVLAFSWYCQNAKKGQFKEKEDSGLIYRVKNIAVGDRHLTRKTLWKTTPERAFHFVGEIHVLDPEVVPSADRTDFEDNAARKRLYERCLRISSNLNRKAGQESATRKFREVLVNGNKFLNEREQQLEKGQLPVELQEQISFECQKLQEDVQKRVVATQDDSLKRSGRRFLVKSRRFLKRLKNGGANLLFDLQRELRLNRRMRSFYDAVISVLKEEFQHDPERLERIIRKIHEAIKTKVPA